MQEGLEALVREEIKDCISPIALDIDCARLLTWAKHNDTGKFRFQYLVKELKAWGPLLIKRPVSQIWLRHPFKIMDAAGLTELMFAIGHNLKLVSGQHVEHLATLEAQQINRENIALLRGLTFNHINISIPKGLALETTKQLSQRVKEFQIDQISFEVQFDPKEKKALNTLMDLLGYLKPETLNFSQPPHVLCAMTPREATAILMQMGYYLYSNQCLMRFKSPLHSRPLDTLRLGPGAKSGFGALQILNYQDPGPYLEHINKGALPMMHPR